VSHRAVYVKDEHGIPLRVIGSLQDISKRKNLEKLRDDLIRAMVHDLRNPLGSVMLSMDLLKTELASALTEEQRQTSERIQAALAQLAPADRALVHLYYFEDQGLAAARQTSTSMPLTASISVG
jgi:K+-sensing histidine kinase KdpD